ncbi:hypothetical protein [uncultured Sulfitobacter sp.]|uniref:hypothetical protein n=1 Tax=uncultured Sulfitobacter sp. TaxID=191468 RepID=UPI0026150382|nr:hypothetical protein [uncultured Sulfitobacter sp.]
MLKTLSASALIAALATSSFAGSLNTATYEAEPADEGVFVPKVGSGIGLPVVVGAVAAAAVLAAVIDNNDDDDDATGTTGGEED